MSQLEISKYCDCCGDKTKLSFLKIICPKCYKKAFDNTHSERLFEVPFWDKNGDDNGDDSNNKQK